MWNGWEREGRVDECEYNVDEGWLSCVGGVLLGDDDGVFRAFE